MRLRQVIFVFAGLLACITGSARAGVVINEIFYHAPADMDEVQWIELFNSGDQPVDLSDWKLDQGRLFVFPKDTAIAPGGYLIISKSPNHLLQIYRAPSIGPFKRALKRGGETLELSNAAGERVDLAKYKDQEPWPASADGYAASLERISPTVSGEIAENWKGSPLPETPRPAGTPGKPNAAFAAALPPAIKIVSPIVEALSPKDPVKVEVEAKDPAAIQESALLHRIVADGVLGAETSQPMERDPATGRFAATIPPQAAGTLLRYRIKVTSNNGIWRFYPHDTDLRPTFSTYIHEPLPASKISLAFILHGEPPRGLRGLIGGSRQPQPLPNNNIRPPRGTSAFVLLNPKTKQATVFDHITINNRRKGGGYKVHFHKDNTLNGMTAISLVFEGSERHLMAEALAYDLYRRAGNAASLTDFFRVWVDGRQAGHYLMIENPNRSFLRRNKIDDSGNLYKIRWYGRGVVGQHEKKTNVQEGHDDLVELVELLANTRGEHEQWKVIQENFNVPQVANYFAVNMVLSHWDGYFNNYYTYHDTKNNKWEIYPWDQDKTWGFHDGIDHEEVFVTMPLTFGMLGDPRPPDDGRGRNPLGPGPAWWRPGGHFSTPLLANPQFRRIFLARVKEILEKHYTEENYFPFIDQMAERLVEDVALRSRSRGGDAAYAAQVMEHNVKLLKTHLQKRRAFLLEQDELKKR